MDHGDYRGSPKVHGLGAEMLQDLENLTPVVGIDEDFHQCQFSGNRFTFVMLEAVDDINQFIALLDDLLQTCRVPANAQGQAGKLRIASAGHDDRIEIVCPAGEYLANTHQYAGLVIDKHAQGMASHNVW